MGAGIAAYKSVTLVRRLIQAGHTVDVIPTPAALEFVGAATWQAVSARPVVPEVTGTDRGVGHVEYARHADLVIIAPATADLLARLRAGMANDMLSVTVLATEAPVVVVPAMHSGMWLNPATVDNVDTLRQRGIYVIEPASGALSSGDRGIGRMPEPDDIIAAVEQLAKPQLRDFEGVRALVTAGGTHEAIDPVRYVGNHSSGKQGLAIAAELARRGARVDLVAANIHPTLIEHSVGNNPAVRITPVTSGLEMFDAVEHLLNYANEFATTPVDLAVCVAAVADFRPAEVAQSKIKKNADNEDGLTLRLVRNPDILATITRSYPEVYAVGFAAETGDDREVEQLGRDKAERKGADLMVINPVG